jgi:radical SAM protein (TIGR01212 family)
LSCPNRDGIISRRGCIFCDRRGSGTGASINQGLSISEQVIQAQKYIQKRYRVTKFIAYFQSFSNTYAPLPKLKVLYEQALSCDGIVGLSVATRPDCLEMNVLEFLSSYQPNYLVWVELGLQSAHDRTLTRINRGHNAACFEHSVLMADECEIPVCAHIILGLPGEDREMMLQTARFLSNLPIQGVKIHLLYVAKETPLAEFYEKGQIRCLEREEYVNLVVDFLELLPPHIVIQRLTGEPAKSELVAPSWAKEKHTTLRLIQETLERRDTWQGKFFRKSTAGKCQSMI